MQKPVTLSESAIAELEAIGNYISAESYPAYAEKIIAKLETEIQKIGIFPKSAPSCDHLLPGGRRLVVDSYLIFYREYESEIAVLHILHGARDLEKFFVA